MYLTHLAFFARLRPAHGSTLLPALEATLLPARPCRPPCCHPQPTGEILFRPVQRSTPDGERPSSWQSPIGSAWSTLAGWRAPPSIYSGHAPAPGDADDNRMHLPVTSVVLVVRRAGAREDGPEARPQRAPSAPGAPRLRGALIMYRPVRQAVLRGQTSECRRHLAWQAGAGGIVPADLSIIPTGRPRAAGA